MLITEENCCKYSLFVKHGKAECITNYKKLDLTKHICLTISI